MATGSSPQDSLNGAGSSIPKLTKKDSDLNLLPPEQQKLQQQSDEVKNCLINLKLLNSSNLL